MEINLDNNDYWIKYLILKSRFSLTDELINKIINNIEMWSLERTIRMFTEKRLSLILRLGIRSKSSPEGYEFWNSLVLHYYYEEIKDFIPFRV
jgi:hypothetical protein